MKAIKKWLMDKEGIFILITWWIILFVVFTILLVVNIKNVSYNLKITSETSPTYIQEFINNQEVEMPYNENVLASSVRPDQDTGYYYLQITKYYYRTTKPYEGTIKVEGDVVSNASLKLDLEVIEEYAVFYNYSTKKAEIRHVNTQTESIAKLNVSIKATSSGSLHIIWNNDDTGIEYLEGDKLELSRLDDVLVINGQNTGISFYKSAISYDKVTHSDNSKTMDYHLEVSYVLGAKTFTTSNVDTSNLNDVEKEVIDASVLYFTELIENSIGVNKSAFALLIVSSVVETLLIGACVFGIVALKRSKED